MENENGKIGEMEKKEMELLIQQMELRMVLQGLLKTEANQV